MATIIPATPASMEMIIQTHVGIRRALRATKYEIISFYSPYDQLVLNWGTSQFGTIDRYYGPSAGYLSFRIPANLSAEDRHLYRRLVQVPWKARTPGEITYWPYMRQTLSPTPQNTFSVLQPLKASLDEYQAEGIAPEASFFRDLTAYLDDLVAGPDSDLTGEESAKAGRVLAARNEDRLREGIDELEQAGWNPVVRKRALSLFASVLDELDRYTKQENP